MVKKVLLLTIVLFLIFNAGCWDLREINDSAVPTSLGIDLGDNAKINFTTVLAEPTPPGQSGSGQMKTIIPTSSDYSVALAARRVFLSLSRVPDWAHVQNMVLGQNIASNGLPLVMDFMTRNRNFSQDTTLFIAIESPPEKLLAQVSTTGSGLKQLILGNEFQLGAYTPTTSGDFTYALMTPGIEPAVPQIMLEEIPASNSGEANGDKNMKKADNKTKRLVLSGTAVFKGHKMTGSLNETESLGYRWLNSHTKTGGFLVLKLPDKPEDYTALEVIRFKSKTSPQLNNDNVKIRIAIDAQLAFYEAVDGGEFLTPKMEKELEKMANQEITRQISSCIHKSQHLNSDIFGWGLMLQETQPDAWKRLKPEWNDVYPFIEFDIKVKTTISHTYLSKKSIQIR